MCITEIEVAPSVIISSIPQWLYPMPEIDLFIHMEIHKNEPKLPLKVIVTIT